MNTNTENITKRIETKRNRKVANAEKTSEDTTETLEKCLISPVVKRGGDVEEITRRKIARDVGITVPKLLSTVFKLVNLVPKLLKFKFKYLSIHLFFQPLATLCLYEFHYFKFPI